MVDGEFFDFEMIKKEGFVVEFVIRKGKFIDVFGEKWEIFFKFLENYDGYKFVWEFIVYKLNEDSVFKLVENI